VSGPWRVVADGPLGLDLATVDGLDIGMGLFGADGDGTHCNHKLLGGEPPEIGWVVRVDRINNRIGVAPHPGVSPSTPYSWHPPSELWLHYGPSLRKHPTKQAYVAIACECGVDKTGVGGLHSDWCPKAGAQ
jgi:hypothetical protein